MNDSVYLLDEERPRFTENEYKENLLALHEIANRHSDNIGFVGLFPINQAILDPIPWAPDKAYRNPLVRRFDDVIREVCSSKQIDFINLMDIWNEDDAVKYLPDGVHPNSEGHTCIAQQVTKFFQKHDVL